MIKYKKEVHRLKKYFIFSDIHGTLKPLVEKLDKLGFDMVDNNHILVSLGDNFDRGVENLYVLGYLRHFHKLGRLIMIRGNHDTYLEDFLLGKNDGIFNIKHNGLGNTLIEFADKDALSIDKIRNSIIKKYPFLVQMLHEMIDIFEIGKYRLIHAGYVLNDMSTWVISDFANAYDMITKMTKDDYIYIFGHTHVKSLNHFLLGKDSNDIFEYKNYIGIDANTILTKDVHVIVIEADGTLI